MKPEILEIGPKYPTDKNDHGYMKLYAEHLPKTASKILEFGVKDGHSIMMLHELYPEAHIYGVDIFSEHGKPPFQADYVTWFIGSQSDERILADLRCHGPFDICIDDASHNHRQQLMTFFGLWGCCKLYVCEDIMQDEFWAQGLPLCDNIKSLNVNAKIYNYEKIKFFYAP